MEQTPIKVELEKVEWNLQGIDALLELLLHETARGIAGGIADNRVGMNETVENQADLILEAVDSNQAGGIAVDIATAIAYKTIQLLNEAINAKTRKELITSLTLVNNANNFATYIQPLVAINWLTMTIPHKPTSPNQKYRTTLKGRIVLALLRRSNK